MFFIAPSCLSFWFLQTSWSLIAWCQHLGGRKNGVLGDDVFYVRHAVSEDCSHCFKSRSKWTSGALTLSTETRNVALMRLADLQREAMFEATCWFIAASSCFVIDIDFAGERKSSRWLSLHANFSRKINRLRQSHPHASHLNMPCFPFAAYQPFQSCHSGGAARCKKPGSNLNRAVTPLAFCDSTRLDVTLHGLCSCWCEVILPPILIRRARVWWQETLCLTRLADSQLLVLLIKNRRATAVQLLHLVDFSKKRRACRSVYNKQNIRIVVLTYVWLWFGDAALDKVLLVMVFFRIARRCR